MLNARAGVSRGAVLLGVVVVLLLAGVGVMLLSRAREGAMRAECSFNLKHIGDGIFLFQGDDQALRDAKLQAGPRKGVGTLPASCIAPGYATWPVQIAPFFGPDTPLQQWEMSLPYAAQTDKVRRTPLLRFFCPARPRSSVLSSAGDLGPDGTFLSGAVGDYACASGDGDPKDDWHTAEADGAIIIGEVIEKLDDKIIRWRARTDFAALRRGQSQTILVGEKHVPMGKFGEAKYGDGSIYNGANFASFARVGGPGYGLAASPAAPFNSNFGSYHVGLCQFLMADNSVRALQNDISEEVLGTLIRRD